MSHSAVVGLQLYQRPRTELLLDSDIFLGWDAPAGVIRVMGPDELGRLLDEHGPALALYARQWCDAPEDVVQEAFLKLVAVRARPTNPAAWLFRVVRNAAISTARRSQRQRRHEGAVARRPWFLPTDAAVDEQAATDALQRLPPEQREAIVAHLWGGLSFAEVAALTGTSTSTAHRNYAAGLAALRERLGIPCRQT